MNLPLSDGEPIKPLWKGRPFEDLSREELIEAARYLAGRVLDLSTPEAMRDRARGRVESLKRGA